MSVATGFPSHDRKGVDSFTGKLEDSLVRATQRMSVATGFPSHDRKGVDSFTGKLEDSLVRGTGRVLDS